MLKFLATLHFITLIKKKKKKHWQIQNTVFYSNEINFNAAYSLSLQLKLWGKKKKNLSILI